MIYGVLRCKISPVQIIYIQYRFEKFFKLLPASDTHNTLFPVPLNYNMSTLPRYRHFHVFPSTSRLLLIGSQSLTGVYRSTVSSWVSRKYPSRHPSSTETRRRRRPLVSVWDRTSSLSYQSFFSTGTSPHSLLFDHGYLWRHSLDVDYCSFSERLWFPVTKSRRKVYSVFKEKTGSDLFSDYHFLEEPLHQGPNWFDWTVSTSVINSCLSKDIECTYYRSGTGS